MTPEEKERLKRGNPSAWIMLVLAEEFPDRNLKRDARMMELIDEVMFGPIEYVR